MSQDAVSPKVARGPVPSVVWWGGGRGTTCHGTPHTNVPPRCTRSVSVRYCRPQCFSSLFVPVFIHCPPFLHIHSVLSIFRLLCALQFLSEWVFVLGVDFGCSFTGVPQGDG